MYVKVLAILEREAHRTEEAPALLKSAVCLDPKLKEPARSEPNFATVRDMPQFRTLVNGKR